jgi:hypothetical protein
MVRKQRGIDSPECYRNARKEALVIANCSMYRLPSVSEEGRDVYPIGTLQRVLLSPDKLYSVPFVSVKGSYLEKPEGRISRVKVRLDK